MRRFNALLALAFFSSAIACGSDSVTNPSPESVAGTWGLLSVNGAALPMAVQLANPKVELLEDQIVLSTGGTYAETFRFRLTTSTGEVSTQTLSDAGSFTLRGAAVDFVSNGEGGSFTATVNGNQFTIAFSGVSQLFVRQ